MTPTTRRQLVMLLVLVVALVVLLYVRRQPQPTGGAPSAVAGEAPARVTPDGAPVADVKLEALEARTRDLDVPERNPFRFEERRERQEVAPAPVRRPEPIAPPVPTGPPPPPPIPLKFIGVIDAPARIGTIAVLSDNRGNVFYGKEGDIIEGRYRVLKIGAESAEVAYADGRGRQTIRLSGQ